MDPPVYLVYTTCSNREAAETLGRRLVEERLAGCATAVPGAVSIYPWKGAVERAEECTLVLKTIAPALPALEARLLELHAYQCPEFVAVAADRLSDDYADWLNAWISPPTPPA